MGSLAALTQLSIGSIVMFVGLAGLAMGAGQYRAQNRTPIWFGLFALLYGVRMLVRLEVVAQGVGLTDAAARYVAVGVTYAILAPAALLTASLFAPGHPWLRRLWQLDLAYAGLAIATDLLRGRPGSMLWLNAPAVTINFVLFTAFIVAAWRKVVWTTGVTAATAGLVAFVTLAAIETYTGGRFPWGSGDSVEPIGMLALVWGLGWLVSERGLANERRLVAISHELETARRIQGSILPAGPPSLPGVAIAGRLFSMTDVAGDFYDYHALEDAAGVLVADVPGHGVPAAIVASMVKIAFAGETAHAREPGRLLTRLNQALSGKSDIGFITAVYACVDVRQRSLVYACAGHPPPLVRRANGDVEVLGHGGLVLCARADTEYESAAVPFGPGDAAVFYTDGVTEAEAPGGEFLGVERLAADLARCRADGAAGLLDELLAGVRAWRGPAERAPSDDITMVVVRSEGAASGS